MPDIKSMKQHSILALPIETSLTKSILYTYYSVLSERLPAEAVGISTSTRVGTGRGCAVPTLLSKSEYPLRLRGAIELRDIPLALRCL